MSPPKQQLFFHVTYFSPFWSLLQLSQVYSSPRRAGSRWDNLGSSTPRAMSSQISLGLGQRSFPCKALGTCISGEPLHEELSVVAISSPPCPAHTQIGGAEGADKQQGHDLQLPPLPSAIDPVTWKAIALMHGCSATPGS